LEVLSLTALGAALGALLTFWIQNSIKSNENPLHPRDGDRRHDGEDGSNNSNDDDDVRDFPPLPFEVAKRKRLPSLVILVRHGESEGNVDVKKWQATADNKIRLTPRGILQAEEAGRRIESIFRTYERDHGTPMDRVHIHVSPFERTMETARHARRAFDRRVVRHHICPRLREQEFGNTQGECFEAHRIEQRRVGRFWYRFPTGESGADVYDRVKSWWDDSLLASNERYGYDHVNAVVVFSHGLALRFTLMQLFSWSPTTFHSVYNVHNCDMYVLKKDLNKPGISPYVLDVHNGDMPRSSIDVMVTFRDHPPRRATTDTAAAATTAITPNEEGATTTPTVGTTRETTETRRVVFKLNDYLNIPPPRMTRIDIVKRKLAEQYPDDIPSVDEIENISFMPFYHSTDVATTSAATGGRDDVVAAAAVVQGRTSTAGRNLEDNDEVQQHHHQWLANMPQQRQHHDAEPESSNRWPICDSLE
jgi:broad specificity phosphatase PhoE